jgi:hypothetical protein
VHIFRWNLASCHYEHPHSHARLRYPSQLSEPFVIEPLNALDHATPVLAPDVTISLIAEDSTLGPPTHSASAGRQAAYEFLCASRDLRIQMKPERD